MGRRLPLLAAVAIVCVTTEASSWASAALCTSSKCPIFVELEMDASGCPVKVSVHPENLFVAWDGSTAVEIRWLRWPSDDTAAAKNNLKITAKPGILKDPWDAQQVPIEIPTQKWFSPAARPDFSTLQLPHTWSYRIDLTGAKGSQGTPCPSIDLDPKIVFEKGGGPTTFPWSLAVLAGLVGGVTGGLATAGVLCLARRKP